jgi:hypothetical protein
MLNCSARVRIGTLAAVLIGVGQAAGQCRQWADEMYAPGISKSFGSARAEAIYAWDDGTGSSLYIGGFFDSVGPAQADFMAQWDGTAWGPVEDPSGGLLSVFHVWDMLAYDDGSGEALYVGGNFSSAGGKAARNIACWDDGDWARLGEGLQHVPFSTTSANALELFDDGSGEALYVGGDFNVAGSVSAAYIASWRGSGWFAVPGAVLDDEVLELGSFDGALYVGGLFTAAGGSPADYIASWTGTSWGALGLGVDAQVHTMAVFDDGSGNALYVGGEFDNAGGIPAARVARWDGTSWSALGAGPDFDRVTDLLWFDDGQVGGPALYAAGEYANFFSTPPPGEQRNLARWDGTSWTELGGGLNHSSSRLALFDDGSGSGTELYVSGKFDHAGGVPATGLARWNGSALEATAEGGLGLPARPRAPVVFDDGSGGGPLLYATGPLAKQVRSWDGSSWSPLGDPAEDLVNAMEVYDDGSGPTIFAAGNFDAVGSTPANGVARWSGTAWEPLGLGLDYNGVPGQGLSLTVWDPGTGPLLVVGGRFDGAGGVPARRIATWNGTTWSSLGQGIGSSSVFADDLVKVLEVYDAGSGPELYAAGEFAQAGSYSANNIARWDGTQWVGLLGGVAGEVRALEVFDDGTGPELYVGGMFQSANGLAANYIARWDGSDWSKVGAGLELDHWVFSLQVFDAGQGEAPKLYAGGLFEAPAAAHLATWNGDIWFKVSDDQPNSWVWEMAVHDDGTGAGPSLFLFGSMSSIGTTPSVSWARWTLECPCPPTPYCTAKVNSKGCTPGIFSTGEPSLSTNSFHVRAGDVLNNKSGLMFWGLKPKASPFQGGTMCIASPTVRTRIQNSGGNPPPDDCSGQFSFHFDNDYITSKGLSAGDTVFAQYWSRDPQSGSTTNLTNALEFTLCP